MQTLTELLAARGPLNLKTIAAVLEIPMGEAMTQITELTQSGIAERIGRSTGRPVEYQLIGAVKPVAQCLNTLAANVSFAREKPEVPHDESTSTLGTLIDEGTKTTVKDSLTTESAGEVPDSVTKLASAANVIKAAPAKERSKPATPRRQPFSATGLTGYHAKPNGTVTLFLDRRLSACSITFTAAQLRKLADDAEQTVAKRA